MNSILHFSLPERKKKIRPWCKNRFFCSSSIKPLLYLFIELRAPIFFRMFLLLFNYPIINFLSPPPPISHPASELGKTENEQNPFILAHMSHWHQNIKKPPETRATNINPTHFPPLSWKTNPFHPKQRFFFLPWGRHLHALDKSREKMEKPTKS